jgi:hypothetical protein
MFSTFFARIEKAFFWAIARGEKSIEEIQVWLKRYAKPH